MKQKKCTFKKTIKHKARLNYLLHLPKNYGKKSKKKWPLILFLHGAGERGDDLKLVKKHGIPKIVKKRKNFPFIAVSPQCPEHTWWSDHLVTLDALLNETIKDYAVDTDRIYLTGLSMGGYGAWHMGVAYPERFAAVVPICGGGLWAYGFPERVCEIKDVPVWAFHGESDEVVSVEESKEMVAALQTCGGDVRFTIYPKVGHDAWTETYHNEELYIWLLEQHR